MSKELKALSDGTFTLSETEVENQFYFYRNDGGVLGDVGRMPMDFYQNYICQKMFAGEITHTVMADIRFQTSEDGRCIRLITSDIGECKPAKKTEKQSKSNFFMRMIKRIFG